MGTPHLLANSATRWAGPGASCPVSLRGEGPGADAGGQGGLRSRSLSGEEGSSER